MRPCFLYKPASYIGASAYLPSATPKNTCTGRCLTISLGTLYFGIGINFLRPVFVAVNRPPWLQPGLSSHRFSSSKNTHFIPLTCTHVGGTSSAGDSCPCTWQCATASSACLPLSGVAVLVISLDQASSISVENLLLEASLFCSYFLWSKFCRPSAREVNQVLPN